MAILVAKGRERLIALRGGDSSSGNGLTTGADKTALGLKPSWFNEPAYDY
jgi:hypothetical protein